MTDASSGAFSIIYYQNATLDVGSQTFLLIKGDEFDPVGVNKLYIELDHDGNLTMNIIITDTETTRLVKPIPTDIQFQPFICEIYACKMNVF